ncbi:unnamed protein product [Mytilus coruscus]|uniref:Uncharacterized protein n=1 Tax=Mytilus coruscus TaxID=42192 RepID=A0A6J8CFA7_MYTCO|nr:unnamed protein product [Mytilus coruscus]
MKTFVIGMSISLLFSHCSSFELLCPKDVSQMTLRAEICKNSSNYMCFYDMNKQTYTEFCNKTDEIQQEGLKTVVRGSFDGVPCDKNHYQPFKYSSAHGDSCVFLKSVCTEEGQIESTDRWPTTSDRTCRCDYRFGYSFVSQPNKPCVCVPSEEDCSCYYKECEKDEVLTPGYLCMHPANITAHFNMFTCPLIEESMSTKTENTKVKKGSGEITKDICPRQKEQNALIVVLTCVVGIQFVLLSLLI